MRVKELLDSGGSADAAKKVTSVAPQVVCTVAGCNEHVSAHLQGQPGPPKCGKCRRKETTQGQTDHRRALARAPAMVAFKARKQDNQALCAEHKKRKTTIQLLRKLENPLTPQQQQENEKLQLL